MIDPSHAQWQEQLQDLLKLLGWRTMHVRKSIGKGRRWQTTTSVVGWPDLACWKTNKGFVFIEAKVGKDAPTVEQWSVLADLYEAGAACHVAYPHHLDGLKDALQRGGCTHEIYSAAWADARGGMWSCDTCGNLRRVDPSPA